MREKEGRRLKMAQVIDKVLNDPKFREAINAHPEETLAELGIAWPSSIEKPDQVVQNNSETLKAAVLGSEFAALGSLVALDATIFVIMVVPIPDVFPWVDVFPWGIVIEP